MHFVNLTFADNWNHESDVLLIFIWTINILFRFDSEIIDFKKKNIIFLKFTFRSHWLSFQNISPKMEEKNWIRKTSKRLHGNVNQNINLKGQIKKNVSLLLSFLILLIKVKNKYVGSHYKSKWASLKIDYSSAVLLAQHFTDVFECISIC